MKSAEMRRVRTVDTQPEMQLRRRLHRAGLRYRVAHPVPGLGRRSIDIAFVGKRLAVFVDGCFWHGCPVHGSQPRTNPAFWQAKLAENKARDADTDRHLSFAGWAVLRLWEHVGPDQAFESVLDALAARDGDRTGG